MKKELLILFVLATVLYSCNNNVTEKYYDTGELKEQIYLTEDLDTSKILEFSKEGKLLSRKEFLKEYYTGILYSTDISYLLDTNTYIYSSWIEEKKENKLFGIQRYFLKPNLKKLSRFAFFVDDYLIGGVKVKYTDSGRTETGVKMIPDSLRDTLALIQSILVYDKNDSLIKEKSFGYIIHSKDTIEAGEEFEYTIEFIDGKFGIDSVLHGVFWGTFDTNGVLDTLNPEGYADWSNNFEFTIKYPRVGYNIITGLLKFGGSKNGFWYKKDVIFYHDFYVKPKEE